MALSNIRTRHQSVVRPNCEVCSPPRAEHVSPSITMMWLVVALSILLLASVLTHVLQYIKTKRTKEPLPICKVTLGPVIIPSIILLVLVCLDVDSSRGLWTQRQLVGMLALEMCLFYVPASIWLAGWISTMCKLRSMPPDKELLVFRLIMWSVLILVIPVHLILFIVSMIPSSSSTLMSCMLIICFSCEIIVASFGLFFGTASAFATMRALISSAVEDWTRTILRVKIAFFGFIFSDLVILFSLALAYQIPQNFASNTKMIPSWALRLFCSSLCIFWYCALVLFLDSYYLFRDALKTAMGKSGETLATSNKSQRYTKSQKITSKPRQSSA